MLITTINTEFVCRLFENKRMLMPMIMMSALNMRHSAQVKGMRSRLSATASISRAAARVWKASMVPAEKRATAMTGVTTSRVVE